ICIKTFSTQQSTLSHILYLSRPGPGPVAELGLVPPEAEKIDLLPLDMRISLPKIPPLHVKKNVPNNGAGHPSLTVCPLNIHYSCDVNQPITARASQDRRRLLESPGRKNRLKFALQHG
ncbi:unnamed protein product, partial [Lymnaea stagnalis]